MFETSKPLSACVWALYLDLMAMRVLAHAIIAFPHIADFRLNSTLTGLQQGTETLLSPGVILHEKLQENISILAKLSTSCHPNSQRLQLQWFQNFDSQDLPWLWEFNSHQMETAEDIWSPRLKASEDEDTQFTWGENKAKGGHFVFCIYILVWMPPFPWLFKWKLLLQLHTARAGEDTCPLVNSFPAL